MEQPQPSFPEHHPISFDFGNLGVVGSLGAKNILDRKLIYQIGLNLNFEFDL